MTYDSFSIGKESVRLLVPSRRKDKLPLDPGLIRAQLTRSQGVFQAEFGGVAPESPPRLGIWRHDDGTITREEIRTVEASASEEAMGDSEKKKRVLDLAADLCHKMDQDCVLVYWGAEGILVFGEKEGRNAAVVRFSELPAAAQEKMIQFCWMGIDDIRFLIQVLSLDGWQAQNDPSVGEDIIATHLEGTQLQRVLREPDAKHKWPKGTLREGDVLISPLDNGLALRVLHNKKLHGPKPLFFSLVGANSSTRTLLQLLLAEHVDELCTILDRKDIRRGFSKEYTDALIELQAGLVAGKKLKGLEFRYAQLFMGRLMFLHFLAQRKWLAGNPNYLAARFHGREGSFYETVLRPLFFEQLNKPDRNIGPDDIPYLNGGLFQPREGENLVRVPDDFCDRVISIFDKYNFTVQTMPGSDDAVSIDPSMFGKVLESLADKDSRKNAGIHYTPSPIAHALAFESIVARLATLANIAESVLRDFCSGKIEALTPAQAKKVSELLPCLRILDPAVGSGALLLACLEVLMSIAEWCHERLGNPLRRGAYAWGELCRRIVCQCLFGVDISEEAVEIAKLRLWLAVAVADIDPTPLPSLEFNVRCADSLLEQEQLAANSQRQKEFPIFRDVVLWEEYFKAIHAYQRAAVDQPMEQHRLLREVENCQRELLSCLRLQAEPPGKKTKKKSSNAPKVTTIPFAWRLHFGHVFHERGGFDVVIANPPYIRVQNIDKALCERYRESWDVLKSGSADIYFAFIQLAIDLAAENGEIAYIMPNFARTDSATALRELLAEQTTIRRWVDFDDTQVFPTATNFVALLFASKRPRSTETFPCSCVRDKSWIEQTTTDWIYRKNPASENLVDVSYSTPKWITIPKEEVRAVEEMKVESCPLSELVDVCVGIQTSADELFLFEDWEGIDRNTIRVYSRGAAVSEKKKWFELEHGILRVCIKGARAKSESGKDIYALWPYGPKGILLSTDTIQDQFPLGWKYLKAIEKQLRAREKGKFDDSEWYRFGRKQGIASAMERKIIVPAIVKGMVVTEDRKGQLTYTASGEGGGGAWGLVPKSKDVDLKELAAYLRSDRVWTYCKATGFPKKDGWRGLDQTVLNPMPVPLTLRKGK